jgi:AcrR family transcriptional regulator
MQALKSVHRSRTGARLGPLVEVERSARAARERIVLDAAADVLEKRGPSGFNVREVARRAGASTIVVYTLFGSRDALLAALQNDWLERLAEALQRVRTGSSLRRLGRLALAYRSFALANPQYYGALSLGRGARPDFARAVRSSRSFRLLVDMVRKSMEDGYLASRNPESVADALWGLVHGIVGLELGGYFDSATAAASRLVTAGNAMLRGFAAESR